MDEFDRIQKMLDSREELLSNSPKEIVNLHLSTQERLDIYNEILSLIQSGEPDHYIAQHVVGILNNHIEKKMTAAKERAKGKSPIFRRVDE